MDTLHLNTYLHLIEALLQCDRGEEWAVLKQHKKLIDAELIGVMAQVSEQLNNEGNLPAAKFLHYWTAQLTHLLQQNLSTEPATENRWRSLCWTRESPNYLSLIQTILECEQGDGVAILSQHPDLMDAGLVYNHVNGSIDPAVEIAESRLPDLVSAPSISPQPSNHLEELLANISNRLEKLETSINKHQNPSNPLWYMSILEQADAQGWIVSSEEVERLIGTKPHCAPDSNSFVRGCWKFEKAGKVGMHSSWRVTKEILTPSMVGVSLPSDTASVEPNGRLTPTATAAFRANQTPEPESTKLELDLSSPWLKNRKSI